MNFRSPNPRRDDVTLDLTPMIDVVFLLLIFFLVTATFAQRDRSIIPIDLPEGATGTTGAASSRATLVISPNGTVTIEADGVIVAEELSGDPLRQELERLRDEDPERPLRLRGDREVPYGTVMEIWDLARQIGFQRVENEIFGAE